MHSWTDREVSGMDDRDREKMREQTAVGCTLHTVTTLTSSAGIVDARFTNKTYGHRTLNATSIGKFHTTEPPNVLSIPADPFFAI